jgi:HNH endonuclease
MSRWPKDDSVYNARWLARIKRRCLITEGGCWEWQGFISPPWNYGYTTYRGKTKAVHRWMYMVTHGVTLAREQYVCHTCDVRHCCNPDHLWLGSNSENQKDSSKKDRHYESRRSHCEHGHEFTPENTRLIPRKGGRFSRNCKQCERDRHYRPEYRALVAKRRLVNSRIERGWPPEEARTKPPRPWRRSQTNVR